MTAPQISDPREFVQYVIAAVEANPDLREPLLRAILTEEFLTLPARVARIEDEILPRIESDIKTLKSDVGTLKDDVGWLRGKAYETDFSRIATSLLNREFGFLRTRVVQGNVIAFPRHTEEFAERVVETLENGTITAGQLQRIFATDIIANCRRSGETEPTWVAVEIASRIDVSDIDRALRSAEALRTVFNEASLPVVAGERIDPPDADRARQAGVAFISLSE